MFNKTAAIARNLNIKFLNIFYFERVANNSAYISQLGTQYLKNGKS